MRGKGPKTFLYCLLIDYIFVCFNKILKKYPHTLKVACLLCSEFVQRLIQTENTAGLKLKIPLTPLRWGIIKRNKASFEFSPTLTQEPGGKESLFNFKSGNNTPQLASKPRSLATKQRTCFILMLKKEYWKCHAAVIVLCWIDLLLRQSINRKPSTLREEWTKRDPVVYLHAQHGGKHKVTPTTTLVKEYCNPLKKRSV